MKCTAIVVDDETLIAESIAKNIQNTNEIFEVIAIFTNGLEAWTAIPKLLPDVVFTDIRMPEMDGITLAQKLYESYPFITCVIVTGYGEFEYAKSALRNNVKDYLLKPIDPGELKDTLAKLENRILAAGNIFESDVMNLQKKPEEIVSLTKEYIHNNYGEKIDLGEIADSFGFSLSWLTKIFVRYADIAPSRYIREYRLNIARQLLCNSDLTIAAISQQTGFLDQFHFSKTFKQSMGISPTEYRKAHLAKGEAD